MNPKDVNGRWPEVLRQLGVDEKTLSGKHCPCPMCGGKDRFRFTNHDNAGLYFCNQCGPGDAIKLLQSVNGWDFKQTMREIESVCGHVKPEPKPERDGSTRLRQVYSELVPARDSLDVRRYLRNRGLVPAPMLKAHPGLAYYEDGKYIARYPAMVGVVQDGIGDGVTLHCTYIADGQKAPVESPKKILPLKAGKQLVGSAVRLYPLTTHMGACEGIETALSAQYLFGVPVWSFLFDRGLEAIEPPEGIQRVTIFGDNDASHAGQKAAHEAAHRLALAGYQVDVKIPQEVGTDWNDVLRSKREAV